MENQDYSSVMGDGTGSPDAGFIASLLPQGATIPNYHGNSVCGGSSENAYLQLTSAQDWGCPGNGARDIGDSSTRTLVDLFETGSITWRAFCEGSCGRDGDHFPWIDYVSITSSSQRMSHIDTAASTSDLVNAVGSYNFLWYTPEDNHNMHDNSVSSGDNYLSGFIPDILSKPAFASQRTLLMLWWDEYNPAPFLILGPTVARGLISSRNDILEYTITKLIEDNWELSSLTSNDASQPSISEFFTGSTPPPTAQLSATFTVSTNAPIVGQTVTFTGTASGGTAPYTYSWNFGDGSTASGATTTHSYSAAGTYTATLTVRDSSTRTATAPSHTLTVTNPSPTSSPAASITYLPTDPITGQTVTFTAVASGGTPPYTYDWDLGGGNTATGATTTNAYANPGTYAVTLTVTDSLSGTGTDSAIVTVTDTVPLPLPSPGTAPVIVGWGGSRLDEVNTFDSSNPASEVFPGEQASNQELQAKTLSAKGLNAIRVSFESQCTNYQEMGAYNSAWLARSIAIAEHYNMWIIVDYHGYIDLGSNSDANCWLSFWGQVVQEFRNSYDMIVWEPLNEPTGIGDDVQYLSDQYQLWIDQARSSGDTHWIVVQNICSFGCGLSNMADGFPTVTDPAGKVFISLHSYMSYSEYSSSWDDGTAESVAQAYYQAVLDGTARTGWPVLNTEGGADELCDNCAPDEVLTGSAGYTQTTMHFIQTLTSLYDANSPERINCVWWTIGSWTDTPGAGLLGSIASDGWGSLLQYAPVAPVAPPPPPPPPPNPQPGTLIGDINGDCTVDMLDINIMVPSFWTFQGQAGFNSAADLNGDGVINVVDVAMVGIHYGQTCP